MKGVIFNVLEKFVVENFGEEVYEDIIETSDLETTDPYVGPGTYPDEDMNKIVAKAVEKLKMPADDILVAFGRFAFPHLAAMFPSFVDQHNNEKDFLKSIEDVIHVEVKKMYGDAYTPTFEYFNDVEGQLMIRYHSKRKLYKLMEGIILGVADHFKTEIKQEIKVHSIDGKEVGDFNLHFER